MLDFHTYVTGLIRTWVPVAIGAALTWVMRIAGIVIDDNTSAGLTFAVGTIVISLYYALFFALEHKYPAIGRWLLALGLTARKPTYPPAVSPSSDGTYRPYQR